MSTYSAVATLLGAQPRNHADRPTILAWIKRKLLVRQQRISRERFVDELRSLDRHQLNDIGIDPERLESDGTVALSRHNPHVIAASIFSQGLPRGGR